MTHFDNSFARDMAAFYTPWQGAAVPAPSVVMFNTKLAEAMGLDAADWGPDELSGNTAPKGADPLAQVYAGHQFGGYSAQLGDGRALLLGEMVGPDGLRRDIALKGSGRTPYSRGGDGKAAIGPVLREYLVAEAMHALGVPTTRALAATLTGEQVVRDTGPLPGAVLTRVASSHLRVGTFQYVAALGDTAKLRKLLDYAIARHHPQAAESDNPALAFLASVRDAQANLIAKWMGLGFVHGVMNTDNMTISGETIDYGPCAFIDTYTETALFSSIDRGGRYAYGNQPVIAQWNLARLAESLLTVIDPDQDRAIEMAVPVIDEYRAIYQAAHTGVFCAKLGLSDVKNGDANLIDALLTAMEGQADFTQIFRALATDLRGGDRAASGFKDRAQFEAWRPAWLARLGTNVLEPATKMDCVNPIYVPRNHLVEDALQAAEIGDIAPFTSLLKAVTHPFEKRDRHDKYALAAPSGFGHYTTFCGT